MGWQDDPEVGGSPWDKDEEVNPPSKPQKSQPGFWDEHPNLKTTMQYGLPLAATAATIPFTGGMPLPLLLATESLASLGAETVNQVVGASERDPNQLGIAALAPGVGRAFTGAVANLPRLIPGFADAIKSSMVQEAKDLPHKIFERLTGGQSSKALYGQLEAQGVSNHTIQAFPELSKAVTELETKSQNIPWDQLQSDLRGVGLTNLFEQIAGTLKGTAPAVKQVAPTSKGKAFSRPTGLPNQTVVTPGRPPGLTFGEVKAATEGMGAIIRQTTDDAKRGNYKKLYGALLTDLENAPRPPGGSLELWKQARHVAKMEHAQFKLAEATEKAIKVKDGEFIFDPNQVVKWLKNNDDIKSRVSPSEFRAIMNEYRNMASVAGHNVGRIVPILGGFIAGGGASGALAGYVGSEAISRALMTDAGRKGVRALVSNPSKSNFRRLGMLVSTEAGAAYGALREDE